jgi:hypothetical protein
MHVGKAYGRLQNLDVQDIIRFYNSVFHGIWNYFSFVDNSPSINKVWWALHESLAFTISRKHRLLSISQVFSKFGYPIKLNKTSYWRPDNFARDPLRLMAAAKASYTTYPNMLATIERSWANKLTRTNIDKTCIICGTGENIHLHHIQQIKDLRKNIKLDFFTKQMTAINRKQVPLCKDHHVDLHRGALCERDRELFALGCKELVSNTRFNRPPSKKRDKGLPPEPKAGETK